MTRNIRKTWVDLDRRLQNPAISLRLYSVVAVVTFLIFGLMGIYPQARTLFEEALTYREMQKINNSLKTKIGLLNQEVIKIENNSDGITALESALPENYEVQNYIVDLSFSSTKAGYGVVGLQAEDVSNVDQAASVSIELDGNGNLGDLIGSIESLKRASQVNKVEFVEKSGRREVTCLLDIYILK